MLPPSLSASQMRHDHTHMLTHRCSYLLSQNTECDISHMKMNPNCTIPFNIVSYVTNGISLVVNNSHSRTFTSTYYQWWPTRVRIEPMSPHRAWHKLRLFPYTDQSFSTLLKDIIWYLRPKNPPQFNIYMGNKRMRNNTTNTYYRIDTVQYPLDTGILPSNQTSNSQQNTFSCASKRQNASY